MAEVRRGNEKTLYDFRHAMNPAFFSTALCVIKSAAFI